MDQLTATHRAIRANGTRYLRVMIASPQIACALAHGFDAGSIRSGQDLPIRNLRYLRLCATVEDRRFERRVKRTELMWAFSPGGRTPGRSADFIPTSHLDEMSSHPPDASQIRTMCGRTHLLAALKALRHPKASFSILFSAAGGAIFFG